MRAAACHGVSWAEEKVHTANNSKMVVSLVVFIVGVIED